MMKPIPFEQLQPNAIYLVWGSTMEVDKTAFIEKKDGNHWVLWGAQDGGHLYAPMPSDTYTETWESLSLGICAVCESPVWDEDYLCKGCRDG